VFDICVPAYNRETLLCELLATLDKDTSVYVSDNGGYLRESQHVTKRATVSSTSTVIPAYSNWNRAASLGSKPFFFLPSDDDFYEIGFETSVTDVIKKHGDSGLIVFGHKFVDAKGNVNSLWVPDREKTYEGRSAFELFRYGVDARFPSILINRFAFESEAGFNESYKVTASDSELIQRIALNHSVTTIPIIISSYRVWQENMTSAKISSLDWTREIDVWLKGIDNLLINKEWCPSPVWRRHFRDEIRLRNMISAISTIGGLSESLGYLKERRYPLCATPRSHFSLIHKLIKNAI